MGIVLFTRCSGFLGRSCTMVLERPTRLATELLDWMSCSFSSWQRGGGRTGCWSQGREGVSRAYRHPPPQRCPAGVSRVEQTRQEDPAALTGWDEGAGDGMGGRTDGGPGWDLSATTPTALQSCMHTPLALVLLGQKSILFQKEKEKRTQHTAKLKSQEV